MSSKDKIDKDSDLQILANQLRDAEAALAAVHSALEKSGVHVSDLPHPSSSDPVTVSAPRLVMPPAGQPTVGKIIEGRFDGQNMLGPNDKAYPVPANYASKSKLVEGDVLKLTIAQDGSFIYKQIGPIERKKLIGKLVYNEGHYMVEAGGQRYRVLFASVTYFKASPGDEVAVVVPAKGPAHWAAIEALI